MFEDILNCYGVPYEWLSAETLTTFKGGGSAMVAMPETEEEFIKLLCETERQGVPYRLLGGGSNTVIGDGISNTLLVSTRRINRIEFDGDMVRAGCGAKIADISSEAIRRGLGGLEFLAGVPATVGGALKFNAGAFGDSVSNFVKEVQILQYRCDFCDGSGIQMVGLPAENVHFAYRRGVDAPVLSATFRLKRMSASQSRSIALRHISERIKKQPRLPSCGSVFINGKHPSGRLIELCGLKGMRIGGAQISPLHANFIVNLADATAGDFLALAELCEREVLGKFGVQLKREFVLIN